MTDEPTELFIPCSKGCPPDLTNITKNAKTLVWFFLPEGDGQIVDVTGLPPTLFKNPRPDGKNFVVDYEGDSGNTELFKYQLTSVPACTNFDAEEAQLTNGPG